MGLAASLVVALAIAAITTVALRSVLASNERLTAERVLHRWRWSGCTGPAVTRSSSERGDELTRRGVLLRREERAGAAVTSWARWSGCASHEEGLVEPDLLDEVARAEQAHEDATAR